MPAALVTARSRIALEVHADLRRTTRLPPPVRSSRHALELVRGKRDRFQSPVGPRAAASRVRHRPPGAPGHQAEPAPGPSTVDRGVRPSSRTRPGIAWKTDWASSSRSSRSPPRPWKAAPRVENFLLHPARRDSRHHCPPERKSRDVSCSARRADFVGNDEGRDAELECFCAGGEESSETTLRHLSVDVRAVNEDDRGDQSPGRFDPACSAVLAALASSSAASPAHGSEGSGAGGEAGAGRFRGLFATGLCRLIACQRRSTGAHGSDATGGRDLRRDRRCRSAPATPPAGGRCEPP